MQNLFLKYMFYFIKLCIQQFGSAKTSRIERRSLTDQSCIYILYLSTLNNIVCISQFHLIFNFQFYYITILTINSTIFNIIAIK
jgi:hypothetical protein